MRNLYLGGRLDNGEGTIRQFAEELENRGHTVLEPWFRRGRLPKPYLMHPETSAPAAQAMIEAAAASEVFIFFPTKTSLALPLNWNRLWQALS